MNDSGALQSVVNQDTLARGWFKAVRSEDALELIRGYPLDYILAAVIAHRARWHSGFNQHGLALGEAMLGDFKSYGMTMRQYRTAKEQLQKWGFATFKTTNRGTIAKLIDTRLFFVVCDTDGKPKANHATTLRQPTDKQATSNEELKEGKKVKSESLSKVRLINPKQTKELIELMDQCSRVLGPKEMKSQQPRWLHRAETEPDKLRRVLADTQMKARESELENPAAWAEELWKHFK